MSYSGVVYPFFLYHKVHQGDKKKYYDNNIMVLESRYQLYNFLQFQVSVSWSLEKKTHNSSDSQCDRVESLRLATDLHLCAPHHFKTPNQPSLLPVLALLSMQFAHAYRYWRTGSELLRPSLADVRVQPNLPTRCWATRWLLIVQYPSNLNVSAWTWWSRLFLFIYFFNKKGPLL